MKNLLPNDFNPSINLEKIKDSQQKENLWIIPPIVDLCTRLGNFSGLHGTLGNECHTARQNGILHVVLPPDTNQILESSSLMKDIQEQALHPQSNNDEEHDNNQGVYLHVLGALTEGLKGERPANVAGLIQEEGQGGCIAVTNAGRPFVNDLVMLRTLEYTSTFGLKVFFYPNEPSLSSGGVAHDGYIASFHGLQGIPWIAETIALSKQLLLVEETGISAHFSQLSTKSSVELIRWAKDKGLPVTCDVAMHQLHLTDDSLEGFNALAHVLPPLRSNTDQKALRAGLADGTIDAICSHHQPLSTAAKQAPFAETQAGISNLDTFVSLGCKLVAEGLLTPEQLVEKICLNPAKIANIEDIYQQTGGAVIIDPELEWTVTAETMLSAGKNTPFSGQTLKGKVVEVIFFEN